MGSGDDFLEEPKPKALRRAARPGAGLRKEGAVEEAVEGVAEGGLVRGCVVSEAFAAMLSEAAEATVA